MRLCRSHSTINSRLPSNSRTPFHLFFCRHSLKMFALRRIAARSLAGTSLAGSLRSQSSSSSSSHLSRSYSTALSLSRRQSQISSLLSSQRRWASGDVTAADTQQEPVADDAIEHTTEPASSSSAAPRVVETQEEAAVAEAAGETTTKHVEGEQQVEYRERRHLQPEQQGAPQVDNKEVFVANLFYDVTERMLQEEFARFGNITRVKIQYDRRGLSRGFGWVGYDSPEAAQRAIDAMHNQMYEGRMIATFLSESKPYAEGRNQRPSARQMEGREMHAPTPTIYIGNMSYEMTDVDLNNLFQPIRNVVDVRVAIDRRSGQPRGFAHADFIDVESATNALKQLDGKTVYGRKLKLDYSKSYGPRSPDRDFKGKGFKQL